MTKRILIESVLACAISGTVCAGEAIDDTWRLLSYPPLDAGYTSLPAPSATIEPSLFEEYSIASPTSLPDIPVASRYEPAEEQWLLGDAFLEEYRLPCSDPMRFCLGGWVAQGYTSNPEDPDNGVNRPVLFNDLANEYLLNQVYVFAEQTWTADDNPWQVGSRVDLSYGYDSHFITVPGLERHQDRTRKWNSENRRNGVALPQAYVEVSSPLAPGVTLKGGHFYAITNYESFAAPANPLYSHSHAFAYGAPFTHTGVLASYQHDQQTTWYAGYTQGWDAWDSPADAWGVLSGFAWHNADRSRELKLVVHAGDDVTATLENKVPRTGSRYAAWLIYQQQLHPELRYVMTTHFGNQEDGVIVVNLGPSTITHQDAQWYGIAQYLVWQIDPRRRALLRFEWFRDEDLSRHAMPIRFVPGGPVLTGGNLWELTVGMNCLLGKRFTVRPEIRYDWTDVRSNESAPGGLSASDSLSGRLDAGQLTLAADLIWLF